MFAVTVLLIVCTATLLSLWCGWGLARLALPPALIPFRAMLTPLLGAAFVMFLGYLAVWTIFSMAQALPIILILCGLLNFLAWRRTGPPQLFVNLREHVGLVLILFVTLLVSLAPLLHYGHAAVIGGGWDVESALPMTRYLERGPIGAIAAAPDNPLRDLVSEPPRIGKTLGFAIWQAAVDLLTGSEAIVSFTPLLAWMRTLGILGVYVLFRTTLRLDAIPALFGAALSSAGALMLWTTFFNFEKQLAGWPMIPLGLILSVAAVEDAAGGRKNQEQRTEEPGTEQQGHQQTMGKGAIYCAPALVALLLAAVALVAQAIAYYPALTIWAPLAIGLGIAVLIESPGTRLRLLRAAAILAAITAVLGIPTVVDYFDGFSGRYDNQVTTLGVFSYVPPTDILGTTAFSLATQYSRSLAWHDWAGVVAAGLLAVLAIVRLPERARWIGLLIGAFIYLAWLRWGQAYAYAYMKGAAYAGFVFAGAAAAGLQAMKNRELENREPGTAGKDAISRVSTVRNAGFQDSNIARSTVRAVSFVLALLLLIQLGAAQWQVVAEHWRQPGLYPQELPALLELRRLVPPGSTVSMTSDVRVQGVISGLAANLLDHAVVWGRVRTGYAGDSAGPTDLIGEYGLLYKYEDPAPRGYRDLVWRGGSFALYRRSPDLLAHQRIERELAPGAALDVQLAAERFHAVQADAVVRVAAFEPARIQVGTTNLDLPAGISSIRVAAVPGALSIHNAGATTVMVQWLTLEADDRADDAAVSPVPAAALVRAASRADTTTVTIVIETLIPDGGPLTLALDIWDTPRGVQYGWYGAQIGIAPESQTITLTLDLQSGAMNGIRGDGSSIPLGAQFQGLRRGDYTARFQVSAGAVLLTEPNGIFSFSVNDASDVESVQAWTLPAIATVIDRAPETMQAQLATDVQLLGYDVTPHPARPGETVQLTLWWRALQGGIDDRSVLIHLLDAQGERRFQADGPPTAGMRPTNLWQPGETVLDARQLTLPPDLPPGEYTLAIGMYRWPSLERLPLDIGGVRQEADIVRLPLRVEP